MVGSISFGTEFCFHTKYPRLQKYVLERIFWSVKNKKIEKWHLNFISGSRSVGGLGEDTGRPLSHVINVHKRRKDWDLSADFSQIWSLLPGNSVWRFRGSIRQSPRYGVNVSVFQRKMSGPGRVWRHHNWAAWKRQYGESVARVTAYAAIQHLLVIVETQTLKSVTSSIKVNEHRINMKIFQNVRDSAGFAATSQP